MSDGLFSDNAIRAAKLALNGLSQRQSVISNNIANVDTPGYRAQELDFESVMKRALKNAGSIQLAATNTAHLGTVSNAKSIYRAQERPGGTARADGNNVDIDTELMDMSVTGIQFQAVSQELGKKLSLLKTIASR
jgi:flagellar basal-body rod protein FlgB